MKFSDLCNYVREEPVFSSGLILSGDLSPSDFARQLVRWTAEGKLIQLRRGLYCLGPGYRWQDPHPFLVANRLKPASYISLQAALSHHGLIPESVPMVTSVTTKRPEKIETALGAFLFRHLHRRLFWGYREEEIQPGQRVFLADPEKALLDLVHLTPGADREDHLRGLRLQNLDRFSFQRLNEYARRSGLKKWQRAAERLHKLLQRGD